jgi:hypothetical protein
VTGGQLRRKLVSHVEESARLLLRTDLRKANSFRQVCIMKLSHSTLYGQHMNFLCVVYHSKLNVVRKVQPL